MSDQLPHETFQAIAALPFPKTRHPIGQTSDELRQVHQTLSAIPVFPTSREPIEQTIPAQSQVLVPPEKIISRLSFSHITELLQIDDPLKRAFYEIECIKGTWSVRELKRQINSLYYERSGIINKELMPKLA